MTLVMLMLLVLGLATALVLLYVLLLKWILPAAVQWVVRTLPLDKQVVFHALQVESITASGLRVGVDATVLESAPPVMSLGAVVVRLDGPVRIFDARLGDLLGELRIDAPVVVVGGAFGAAPQDARLAFSGAELALADSVEPLKRLLRSVVVGGQREIDRATLRIDAVATVDLLGVFVLAGVPLSKTVHVGEVRLLKAAASERRRQLRLLHAAVETHLKQQQALIDAAFAPMDPSIAIVADSDDADNDVPRAPVAVAALPTPPSLAAIHAPTAMNSSSESEDAIDEKPAVSDRDAHEDAPASPTDLAAITDAAGACDVPLPPPTIGIDDAPSGGSLRQRMSHISLKKFVKRESKYGIPSIDKAVVFEAVSEAAHEVAKEALTGLNSLIPVPVITPRPITPLMRSIIGGLDIHFPTPPNANISLKSIRFDVTLNGSKVSHGTVYGLRLSNTSTDMTLSLEVVPAVVSSEPILGLASTAKGMLKGAVQGALNGLLYGEWGAGATVIGISHIEIQNENGVTFPWLTDLLSVVEIEHDLDAVRALGSSARKATTDIRQSVLQMAAEILDVAGRSGPRCGVM